ncbi:M23 family metallopeptidase [Flavobacterium macacae]|uniref:M23 family peptidase n=1 Tax=Flavobacterium macacae TaxID=2488993 RepID=A0A3P3W701_9FLAO|nr:peptidoglycan DD-metalloendopeptidase family protein [Flavobacterium macacae]RRJ89746.1 M23 family peptidase [Flavobacterium macacae]
MKYKILSLLFLFALFSCNDKKEKTAKEAKKEVPVKEPVVVEFGFTLNDFKVENDTVQSGDTFGTIMDKHDLGEYKVHEITEKARDSFNFRDIRAGKPYVILKSKTAPHQVQVFIYQKDNIHYNVIDLRDSIVAYRRKKPLTIKRRTIATEIKGSLSETLSNAGVDPSMAQNLADIYAYSVDFFKIQKGDKFAVTFDEKYINDTIYAGVESLQASFFEYKGKKIYAFPFKHDTASTKTNYYDEEGKVLKTMFLKAPLKFGFRISSKFSKNRFHPVQQRFKAHNGTDYAASHGTPIITTASGVVERTGYTAGNGNYVKVKHDRTYSTQYLHMSKILVRQGQRVSQGDVIGKVGSTGLATGPHVCYRFWKNGVQVDALKQKLPSSIPMDAKYKSRFISEMTPMKKELDSIATLKFKK